MANVPNTSVCEAGFPFNFKNDVHRKYCMHKRVTYGMFIVHTGQNLISLICWGDIQ